jgi:hypothetical protein
MTQTPAKFRLYIKIRERAFVTFQTCLPTTVKLVPRYLMKSLTGTTGNIIHILGEFFL